ncbi:MAG TPA: kelch repeat-containing protein [Actinomycetota bacterium]
MNRRQQRLIGLILVGILTAGALVGGGWWLGQRSDRQSAASGVTVAPSPNPPAATPGIPDTSTTPAPPTSQAQAGSWQWLPAAPIPAGATYAGVWTGSELLVHGAYFRFEDEKSVGRSVGAAYRPTTRTWRVLPPAPGPLQNMEGGYHAIWTGRELLGWGMGLDAAYNPATNRWRRIAPGGSAWAVRVWTGRQVLTWGGGCCGDDVAGGAAYTPATNRWSNLPAAPLAGRQQTAGVWTGSELIVVGGNNTDGKVFADAAAYDPVTRSWRRLPPMPEARTGATVTWNGREVLVVGGQGRFGDRARPYADGVAYSPASNAWRRLPAMDSGRIWHSAVCTGRQLLVWGGQTRAGDSWTAPAHGLTYDRAANRWLPLPRSPLRGRTGHLAVWTGSQLLIWGGIPVRHSDPEKPFADGAAYTPYPV